MTTAAPISSGIGFEVLSGDNYKKWSLLMKNYLIGEGLWDNIISRDFNTDLWDNEYWRRRNAKALYAIRLSCAPEYFEWIRKFDWAGDAWACLNRLDLKAESSDTGIGNTKLHTIVESGNWDAADEIITENGGAVLVPNSSGKTVLHIAVIAGHEHIVKNLVNTKNAELLKMQDQDGYTALALVAQLNGNTIMAKCMVEENEELLTMTTHDDEIPLVLASARGHKELTRYLYSRTSISKTSIAVLTQRLSFHGGKLLRNCISTKIFDVALELLRSQHQIPVYLEVDDSLLSYGGYDRFPPLFALAKTPSAFRSGCRLHWWERPIYTMLRPQYQQYQDPDGTTRIEIKSDADEDNSAVKRMTPSPRPWLPYCLPVTLIGKWLLARVQVRSPDSVLLKIPAIKEVYDTKLDHYLVGQILDCLPERVLSFNERVKFQTFAHEAMLQAAKYGIVEVIESMSKVNPNLLWGAIDNERRGVFSHAILNRQEKMFNYLCERAKREMRMITHRPDMYGNNMLHHAAELGPSSDLDSRFGAALQMQTEIRWFKKVKEIAHPNCKEATNVKGKKPHEVFTESHKELVEAGDKWAKGAAQSFTIVCTLIITITFAAAFTVPGGNNQESGFPIFLKRTLFEVFIMADVVSLVTSSSSVLISIVILTSRYAEQDFVVRLPLMLMANLLFLFMSVAAMMVAFCAGIAMMCRGYRSLVRATISLACLPIVVFVATQLPLFFKIAKSTIGLKGFKSILVLLYDVFFFIPYIMSVYLMKKIKGCGIFCFRRFARGANFLAAN